MDFHSIFTSRCLVTDGAMGTYYREKYGEGAGVPELDNLKNPERIRKIHREYIEAGADIIRTNSFASNIQTLCRDTSDRTREEQLSVVYENVSAACRIAQSAVEEQERIQGKETEIYIAGDIGPIPEQGGDDEKTGNITEEYKTMAKAHLDAGVRLIWFETFSDLERILPVAKWIRSVSDAFIMTGFSVNMFGYTKSGVSMSELLRTARESGLIDGVGFNCGIGPSHLSRLLKRQDLGDMIVYAAPNAGYADRIENRMVYRDNSEYFSRAMEEIAELGVNIIGGCCGTNPAYIEKLARTVGHRTPAKRLSDSPEQRVESEIRYDNNLFIRKLYSGEKVVIAELDPPFDGNDRKMGEAAAVLKDAGVEMITFSDSPMGKMRASSVLAAVKISNQLQIETMPHMACRDRNVIGMGSDILGAYMNGIRNFLFVTGDPVPAGDRGNITSVYDYHSVTLMNYVRQMNREHFAEDPIAYGGALNYGRANIDAEIRRMEKKCEAGASFFLTQPVYSDEDIERIRYIKSRIDTKIICGIMPLVSYRNAVFMKNEITGINVPDEIIEQYDKDMSREEAQAVGVRIAAEIAEKLGEIADGYYFMVPFNRAGMIAEILERMERDGSAFRN
ncbi:MAG TPA: bifunctional homocysteine S-methyltransferase/methylenetetrahydrofolate reductase [Candidatus Mediterraneibacter norfolkensis]|nr:bifunctional homocysteine S-methyltransferase/methylenetetrahydrofolate reductase [Candidatus Mediterraneibacter norfolkensis]